MLVASEFQIGDKVVYPSHGVAEIINIETETIAGMEIQLFVIKMLQDKMVVRVPVKKATSSGLRKLIDKDKAQEIYNILKSKPKAAHKMWSKKAQEFEAKIISGQLELVAEVVRDLHKSDEEANRSYSEITLYESAMKRLVAELSIIESKNENEVACNINEFLKDKVMA
jgi:CarD family transcriptional regulator